MWWLGRIYFVTDRDGTMNLWSMNPEGRDLTQHTRHDGWDVKEPSLEFGQNRLPARCRPMALRHRGQH